MQNTLRVKRAERRLIQVEVAQALGKRGLVMSASKYSLIENGHVVATPAERAALAELFDTTEEALFPGLTTSASSSSEVQR